MAIEAGKLRHRMELQKDVGTEKDGAGRVIPVWVTQDTRWCSIEPLSGRELWRARQAQADVTHTVKLRHVPGITPKWRGIHEEKTFEILTATTTMELEEETVLLCKVTF